MTAFVRRALVAALALGACVSTAAAQGATWTGFEAGVQGPANVRAGRSAQYRGVAYRVRGLAELVPFEGPVRARVAIEDGPVQPWTDATADAAGHFVVDVPVPAVEDASAALELRVGSADESITLPVQIVPGVSLTLTTDRRLYEPGEPVHVWGLLRDVASGQPIASQPIEVRVEGASLPPTRRTVETNEAGVIHLAVSVPDRAPEASQVVEAHVAGQLTERAEFRVGTRTWERLFVTTEVEPELVPPGGSASVRVRVTTPSGAPVRDASVGALVDGSTRYTAITDADGEATLSVRAPVYHVHETGRIGVQIEVAHPAHGSVEAYDSLRLAVPLALRVEVVPPHGGLVPELDEVLFVRLRDGAGDPPASGTEVTVEGPAVRGGSATATTDDHGLAEIPIRAPIGVASSASGEPETSVLVRVAGPLERTSRLGVRVLRRAEVAPTLDAVVVAPGATVRVAIGRRPSVARAPVVAELLDDRGEPVAVRWVPARATEVQLDVPPDRIGVMAVRVRALHEDEVLEGTGALAHLIVRPRDPDFAQLRPERRRWTIGETARVTLSTGAGGPRRWAAVLVRDLAAHGGEVPFREHFLRDAFDRAVLDPSGPSADLLLRAALAAHGAVDPAPPVAPPVVDALGLPHDPEGLTAAAARGTLRDPWPLARELARRGVAAPMIQAEALLREALTAGALDAVTTGAGARRRFAEDLFATSTLPDTLGGAPVTPAILEAADPSFTYDHVGRRVARARLVHLMAALALYLDPGDDAPPAARMAAREPWARWLPRMVERGLLTPHDLDDPWGGRFALRPARAPIVVVSAHATELELFSPGPDGRPGTRDDVRDPFERAVPAGTPYAVASGEDALMRRLAVLSPLERTLAAIRVSYRRVNVEMSEEEIGDAVRANVSEGTIGLGGLGTVGHGGGSGGGSGYGRGGGGIGSRLARVARVRQGNVGSGLAAVVRERFPPTLLFRPSLAVDPSGATEIEIELADAVTTYLVEAIVWREDGWVTSASTRIEVDRDIVVDAPVPGVAHRGDRLRLPVRAQNRGQGERTLTVRLLGDASLGIEDGPIRTVTVGPRDAVVVPIDVAFDRVGAGTLTAVVSTSEGEPLDAVRRSIEVLAPARRVEVTRDALADAEASITIDVPAGASARGGVVRLSVGPAMFAETEPSTVWARWGGATVRRPPRGDTREIAFALGGAWQDDEITDAEVARGAAPVARTIDRATRAAAPSDAVELRAWALLGLAPAAIERERRDAAPVLELVTRLREEVSAGSVALSDAPEAWVIAAAALGWSDPDGDHRGRVAELARRIERHAVVVGDDRWLPTDDRPVLSTLLWSMVELSLGRRAGAFERVATVGRWVAQGHALAGDERAIARAVLERLLPGASPERAVIVVDGARHPIELEHGAAQLELEALSTPGTHEVRVEVEGGAPLWVRATARYGVPWTAEPETRGPFDLEIEGEVGGLDRVSELELTVRNRTPRTLGAPIVEIELPTGAELTARDEERMREDVRSIERGAGVLTLTLAPMRPGNERRIPLPFRWSVAGRLHGLGVSARASDRPEAVSVARPRALDIREVGR